jgi:membrane-associated phospholipid phosphatase
VLHAWRRANFADRMYLVYFVGIGILILVLRDRVAGYPAFLALHVVCTAMVLWLVLRAHRFPTAHAWYPLAMPLITFEEVAQLNFLFVNAWRDHYVLAFEAWLFAEPPTVWLSRHASTVVTEILQIGYLSYFFLLIIVGSVLYWRADKAPFFGVMAASVLSYMLCYVVFVTFPTEGPAHTLRQLHSAPIAGGPLYALVTFTQRAGVHGNAFPSAHVAGAVAALIFAWRYARRLGACLTPFVLLLCVGAVYDRYHYASDVFAGLAVGAAATRAVMWAQARPHWARRLNIALMRIETPSAVSRDDATPRSNRSA